MVSSRPRRSAIRSTRVGVALLIVALVSSGCARPNPIVAWWKSDQVVRQEIPLPDIAISMSQLDEDLAGTQFEDEQRRDLARLSQLADIFYQRLSHRRLNSIATYHDPALREFFHSEEAFADYYADLVQRLGDEHFQANRPREIALESLHVEEGAARVVTVVKFRGLNSLPLRFWSVDYSRRDVWERADDRWWIIPGKL